MLAGNACSPEGCDFGMVMRGRKVEIGTFCQFLRHAHDRGVHSRSPSPVSITSVPRLPTTIPTLGNPPQRIRVIGHLRQTVFGHSERLGELGGPGRVGDKRSLPVKMSKKAQPVWNRFFRNDIVWRPLVYFPPTWFDSSTVSCRRVSLRQLEGPKASAPDNPRKRFGSNVRRILGKITRLRLYSRAAVELGA